MNTPLTRYRVWPDGTAQELSEAPYSWMSDDFITVDALDEADAVEEMNRLTQLDNHAD